MDFDRYLTIVDKDFKMIEGDEQIRDNLLVTLNVRSGNGVTEGEMPYFADYFIDYITLFGLVDNDYIKAYLKNQFDTYWSDTLEVGNISVTGDREKVISFEYTDISTDTTSNFTATIGGEYSGL